MLMEKYTEASSGFEFKIGGFRIDLFWIIPIGLFFFPTTVRGMLLDSEIFRAVNIVAWFAILIYLIIVPNGVKAIRAGIPTFISLLILYVITIIANKSNLQQAAGFFLATVLPVLWLNYRFFNKDFAIKAFKIWYQILYIAMIIIIIGEAVNAVSNNASSVFFANLYGNASYFQLVNAGRLVSFYGHVIFTKEIILLFYVTGVLAHRYKVFQGTEIVYTAIAVIAMAITTSKMGIVLILVGILYFNFNRKRIRYIVIMTLVGYATYSIGLFDAILERFNVAFSSGDITTGRNTALVALYSSGALSFDLLGGAGFTNMSTAMIAALEYPLLRLAYRHGIIYAVIVLLSVFVIPAIRLIRAHKMDLFVALLLIALDINTFDSIASVGDYMLIYCTFACLLMNLTDMDYEKVIPDRKKKIDIRLRG